jgi:hypothetical protein
MLNVKNVMLSRDETETEILYDWQFTLIPTGKRYGYSLTVDPKEKVGDLIVWQKLMTLALQTAFELGRVSVLADIGETNASLYSS